MQHRTRFMPSGGSPLEFVHHYSSGGTTDNAGFFPNGSGRVESANSIDLEEIVRRIVDAKRSGLARGRNPGIEPSFPHTSPLRRMAIKRRNT